MGSSSKSQTVGYKYFMGIHKILCSGPVDKVMKITIDDKVAWEGIQDENGEIEINQPNLFGGSSIEGGFVGKIDIEMGGLTQQPNPYLLEKVSPDIPAFRGVLSAILKHCYYAMNPNIKQIHYKVSRIHKKENGIPQWYDEKSEINYSASVVDKSENSLGEGSDGWKCKVKSQYGGEHPFSNEYPVVGTKYDLSSITNLDGFSIDASMPFSVDGFKTSIYHTGRQEEPLKSGIFGKYFFHVNNELTKKFTSLTDYSVTPPEPYEPELNGKHLLIDPAAAGFSEEKLTISGFGDVDYTYAPKITDAQGNPILDSNGKPKKMPEPYVTHVILGKEFYFYGDLDKGFEIEFYSTIRCFVWLNQERIGSPSAGFGSLSQKLTIKRILKNQSNPALGYYGLQKGKNLIILELANNYSTGCVGGSESFVVMTKSTIDTSTKTQPDMNPAHIIRECLTESWGLGYSEDAIDDNSFRKAADTLYKEGLGISIQLTSQVEIQEFLNKIYEHINATLYTDRRTGKFVLKLIRDDYSTSNLFVLNEKNVNEVTDYSRLMPSELTNSVTVTYTNASIYEPSTVTVQDYCLQNSNGGSIVSVSKNYEGFTNPVVASKIAQRDLKALSSSMVSCRIKANYDASVLNLGDRFILNWPENNTGDLIMRVIEINYGNSDDYSVKIKCIQDNFKELESAIVQPDNPSWQNPISDPKPATPTLAFEIPYYSLIRNLGEDNVNNSLQKRPEIGFVGCGGGKPTSDSINARMYTSYSSEVYSYKPTSYMDFMPAAQLSEAVTEMTTIFKIKNGKSLNLVDKDSFFQIDDELVGILSISNTEVSVKRGCMDTIPKPHNLDAYLNFWEDYYGYSTTEFVTNDVVNVKICPITLRGELDIGLAQIDSVTIKGRAYRPYPPANVKFNGQYFPEYIKGEKITVTWVHRNRVQQTSGMIGFTDGNITPEVGTSYVISFYGETGELKKTYETTSNTQAWDTEQTDCGFTDRLNNRIKVTIQSKRDNVLSMQTYYHEIIRVGYGYSYGIYYGGL